MNFVSLREKLVKNSTTLLLVIVPLMIILLMVVSMLIINNSFGLLESKINESLNRKGELLIKNNSLALIGMVEDNAFSAVDDLVSSTVSQDSDIEYGIFMDESMMVWVNYAEKSQDKQQSFYTAKDDQSLWANEVKSFSFRPVTNNKMLIEFAAAVVSEGDRLGTIRYGINTASIHREIRTAKQKMLNFLYGFLGLLAIASAGIVYFAKRLSHKQAIKITEPLDLLTQSANAIANGDYSNALTLDSNDEIGILAHDFEIMRKMVKEYTTGLEDKVKERTAQLEAAQQEAVENAHKAGMADIATGTLHNIGNLLNSVVTSANMIKETQEISRITGFYKAIDLIKQHQHDIGHFFTDNPKGSKLIEYLIILEQDLVNENDYIDNHLARLLEKIDTMSESIAAQQQYANANNTLLEALDLKELVENALSMNSETLHKHDIALSLSANTHCLVQAQKNKVIQVIVNILVNAQDAMLDTTGEKKINVVIEQQGDTVILSATDSGCGIEQDNMEKIFNHGFTTKKTGHGFGLHSSANYMTEMGGRMWAESAGPGTGATFKLAFLAAEEQSLNEQSIDEQSRDEQVTQEEAPIAEQPL